MKATTVKLSVETRDRIRALGAGRGCGGMATLALRPRTRSPGRSNNRFHRVAGRALVAPQIIGEPDEVPFPWRVQVDDGVYAIDLMRSLPVDRLLDRIDRAPAVAMAVVRRALLNIT